MPFGFTFISVALVLLVQFRFARSECSKYVAGHEVVQSPNSVYAFDDEGGMREIQGIAYSIGNCKSNSRLPTGAQYVGNFTFIGHTSEVSTDECLIKQEGGKLIYDTVQAVVFTTNGWTFSPTIDLDDIDAQSSVAPEDGWKESMAVFGVSSGNVVQPIITLHNNTLLEVKEYSVPASATKDMELNVGEVTATGAQYGSLTEMINCPFGRQYPQSARCRMTVRFDQRIDTLVIMYALAQNSKNDPSAAAFFSELVTDCGCRCREADVGARMITVQSETPNECYQRQSSGLKTECDLEGSKWCTVKEKIDYVITGPRLSNGNFPCEATNGTQVDIVGDFTPASDFVKNII